MTATVNFTPILTNTGTTSNLFGGGGFVTGLDVADDGTMVTRHDSTGPRIRGPAATAWSRLFVPGTNMNNASLLDIAYGQNYDPSVYGAAICATNSLVAYFVVMGYVWKTTDGGATVTRTALAQKANCFGNDTYRTCGKPLAVDPQNGNVVFFGSYGQVQYSLDGGANWTAISTGTIPAPTAGQRYIIAFDRHSTVTSGKTQGIYIFVPGSGLYRSTNGGTSWAAVSGAPTTAGHMAIGPSDGYVHLGGLSDGSEGQYRRWDGTTWTAPTGVVFKSLALSTINAGRMWGCTIGGGLWASTNNGVNWTGGAITATRVAADIPWLAWTDEDYMSNGDLLFNPASGALVMAEGIGTWTIASPPTTISGSTTWTENTKGIESLVGKSVDVGTNGLVYFSCWDRFALATTRTKAGVVFPSTNAQVAASGSAISNGGLADVSSADATYLVTCGYGRNGMYSTDSGYTWSNMPATLLAASGGSGGGNIIAFTNSIYVQIETDDGKLMRTTDAAASWTRCTIGNNLNTTAHHSQSYNLRILVKDENVAGQAYYKHVGDGSGDANDLACRGIWKTTDSGANWSRIKTGYIIGFGQDYYHAKFRQLGSNTWLFSGGDGALGLWRSTDGMVTWSQITGTDNIFGAVSFGEVLATAVGAPISPSVNKTIYAIGHRQAVPAHATDYSGFGLWYSTDLGANWTRQAQFPYGYFSITQDLAADPTYNYVYAACGGEGVSKIVMT